MLSKKQYEILAKNGYSDDAIQKMDYNLASKLIGEILHPKDKEANQAPYHKEIAVPNVEKVLKNKGFDNTSAFTRQATDLTIAMLDANKLAVINGKAEPVDIGLLMAQAILCVRAAVKEFG